MKKTLILIAFMALICSCKMENPLIRESKLPYGAPEFDKIKMEHYKPAFEAGIAEGKANIDKIVADTAAPTFRNVIVPMEFASPIFDRTANIFFNLMEAHTNDSMQALAEEIAPMLTEYSLYVSLNRPLFQKVRTVYENRFNENLKPNEIRLLEQTYKSFTRSGANLEGEDRDRFAKLSEEGELLGLKFSKNVLAATNAFTLNVTDSSSIALMPANVLAGAAETASERGEQGWTFTLAAPSYVPFMEYCTDRQLRRRMYVAYRGKSVGGDFDNSQVCKDIIRNRIEVANLLGYPTYADYALETRMAGSKETVNNFLKDLMDRSLPFALDEVGQVEAFARSNGFEGTFEAWDFTFWSERLKEDRYSFEAEQLKPYFEIESCIDAVFSLAGRLYGLRFEPIDLPVYHKDVKVYDVKDTEGNHMALLYADFYPRDSKRGGAWMTEFRGQSIKDGVERRPFISIVTNFTKPTADEPSLITHDEFITFLHEFGHAIHGMLAQGEFPSQTGTNVARDFVELPSQINENWGYEAEFLGSFAKHYRTGEPISEDLISKIIESKNYLSGYSQVRQLQFGIIDMAWHCLKAVPEESATEFENRVLAPYQLAKVVEGTSASQSFSHIFKGGYSAGYYSYKWAEVLEADAFEAFKQSGIFDKATADSFKNNILTKGDTEDPAVLYRNFRGRDPQSEALMRKLGLTK